MRKEEARTARVQLARNSSHRTRAARCLHHPPKHPSASCGPTCQLAVLLRLLGGLHIYLLLALLPPSALLLHVLLAKLVDLALHPASPPPPPASTTASSSAAAAAAAAAAARFFALAVAPSRWACCAASRAGSTASLSPGGMRKRSRSATSS